jgi:hypothetical protein
MQNAQLLICEARGLDQFDQGLLETAALSGVQRRPPNCWRRARPILQSFEAIPEAWQTRGAFCS